MNFQTVIIGGGLAGLLNAVLLARAGIKVALVEKKQYPFHKVCGEYISHEVTPFLKHHGLFPQHLNPAEIDQLQISGPTGKIGQMDLPLGGFGISRYALDHFWYQQAKDSGVEFYTSVSVDGISFQQNSFLIQLSNGLELQADLAIGAYGKRSLLDKKLGRSFISRRSAYVGVKYHLDLKWDPQKIALHSFDGGYCGISSVENGRVNLCYLTRREKLKEQGSIPLFEENVLKRNPHLKLILESSTPLFEQPLVINEVSFAPKKPVEQHILMSGDAAGLITPLCGNGMAMAIKSAFLLNPLLMEFFNGHASRSKLETEYSKLWRKNFLYRLSVGRKLQRLFEKPAAMNILVGMSRKPRLARLIVQQTHGAVFGV